MSESTAPIALQQFLSETSAHGLSRLGGNRPIHVRLFWALSFSALTVAFGFSFVSSVTRFMSRDSKTTFYTERANFTFPDMFVCGLSPFSGSYSLSLTEEEAQSIGYKMRMIYANLPDTIKYKVPQVVPISFINSLPFQTLADHLGHRRNQMVFYAKFLGEGTKLADGSERIVTNITNFYHPDRVTCTKISLTETEKQLLKQSDHGIQLFMMVDRMIPEFPIDANQIFMQSGSLRVYPPEWSFNQGWNAFGESGLRLFLVEPGTFPAPWSTNVLLKPGINAEIKVSMLQTEVSETDFPDDCVPESRVNQVHFHNPYTPDEPYTFKYSYAYCYYNELTQRMQQLLNCTAWRHPMPASHSDLPNCFNSSGQSGQEFWSRLSLALSVKRQLSDAVRDVARVCSTRRACSRKDYQVDTSSTKWPLVANIKEFLQISDSYFLSRIVEPPTPMLDFALNTFRDIRNSTRLSDWQNLTRLVRSQLLQVQLKGEGQYSTMVQVTLDYTLLNLFAETGGFLGLYLGCSVLTLAELLELLHNAAVLLLCKSRHRVTGSNEIEFEQTEQKEATVPSVS